MGIIFPKWKSFPFEICLWISPVDHYFPGGNPSMGKSVFLRISSDFNFLSPREKYYFHTLEDFHYMHYFFPVEILPM